MKHKLFLILMIISILVTLIISAYFLILDYYERKDVKKIPCYDNKNNEIIGLECTNKNMLSDYILAYIVIFVVGLVLILLFIGDYYEE